MFGNKRRKAIRALNRVSLDHALRIEMLELKIKSLLITQEHLIVPKSDMELPPSFSPEIAEYISRYNNLNERGQPRCGVWSPWLGACIRDWPHKHEDITHEHQN